MHLAYDAEREGESVNKVALETLVCQEARFNLEVLPPACRKWQCAGPGGLLTKSVLRMNSDLTIYQFGQRAALEVSGDENPCSYPPMSKVNLPIWPSTAAQRF